VKVSRERFEIAKKHFKDEYYSGMASETFINNAVSRILFNLGIEVEEPEASILAEKWWYDRGYESVCELDGEPVCFNDFKLEIAALPDALRALMRVRDRSVLSRIQSGTRDCDIITMEFNPDEYRVITDALDKAGIE